MNKNNSKDLTDKKFGKSAAIQKDKKLSNKGRRLDLLGKRFGRLVVVEYGGTKTNVTNRKYTTWKCLCDCGNTSIVKTSLLTSGKTKSCGCYRKEKIKVIRLIDLTGKRFGKLVVLSRDKNTKHNQLSWLCQCDCGNKTVVAGYHLSTGHTSSCGCLVESVIAHELKKYCVEKYNAITEYPLSMKMKNSKSHPRYDIYIPNGKIFIEVNGLQHYKFSEYFHQTIQDFRNNKMLDRIKRKYAKKNGTFIEIDLRKIRTTKKAISYFESFI
jgi:hypothetical protein